VKKEKRKVRVTLTIEEIGAVAGSTSKGVEATRKGERSEKKKPQVCGRAAKNLER